MNIYVCSQKIIDKEGMDFFILAEPISLLGKLKNFLVYSNEIDCIDHRGSINFKKDLASTHFLIFGKETKKFFEQIVWFCSNGNIFLFNPTNKTELQEKEKIFFIKNKKTKEYIQSLKDEYDIHKANKSIIKMASCIRQAEDIVSGKIKVH